MRNNRGSTALCTLAEAFFMNSEQSDMPSAFDLLSTKTNINIPDNNYVTAYSWILRGKLVAEGLNKDSKETFSRIEEIFTKKGADLKVAQKGLGSTLLLWVEAAFSFEGGTLQNLKTLSDHISVEQPPSFPNHHNFFEGVLNIRSNIMPVILSRHPKLCHIILNIIGVLTSQSNTSFCGHLNAALLNSSYYVTSFGWDLLNLTIQKCCHLTEFNMSSLRRPQNSGMMPGKHHEAYLKVLLSACKEETVRKLSEEDHWLGLLLECYIIPANSRKLGGKLAHSLYGTIERCLEIKQLDNCLFFASHQPDMLDDHALKQVFEIPMPENSFSRGPLHLAVSLLHDKVTLDRLPSDLISKQLQSRDLHGCTPLHIAHLHQNHHAIELLKNHGADTEPVDHFGLTPFDLYSRLYSNGPSKSFDMESCMDAQYRQLCSAVMTAETGVLDKLKPLLIISPSEADALTDEIELLFRRLLKGTLFEQTEVSTAGSMREKLKAGRLDEIDVQLRMKNAACCNELSVIEYHGKSIYLSEFLEAFMDTLCTRLHKISWRGINLRLISSAKENPWKLLREGHGPCSGVAISVDIVPIYCLPDKEEPIIFEHKLADIIEGAPPHSRRWVSKWKRFHHSLLPQKTTFVLEWDILDSLPTCYRLGVTVAKALIQAYDWSTCVPVQVEMPITSYMLKTSLFFILKGSSDIRRISQALDYAIETTDELSNAKETPGKLKFKPNPTWVTEHDISEHAEDARIVATQIFRFIHFLAKRGCKVISYWQEPRVSMPHRQAYMGEVAYIADICQCLLERLENRRFF